MRTKYICVDASQHTIKLNIVLSLFEAIGVVLTLWKPIPVHHNVTRHRDATALQSESEPLTFLDFSPHVPSNASVRADHSWQEDSTASIQGPLQGREKAPRMLEDKLATAFINSAAATVLVSACHEQNPTRLFSTCCTDLGCTARMAMEQSAKYLEDCF